MPAEMFGSRKRQRLNTTAYNPTLAHMAFDSDQRDTSHGPDGIGADGGCPDPACPRPRAPRAALHAYGQNQHEALVQEHAPLVRRIALQLVARLPSSIELDDLIQAGMLGLLDAISRYREMPSAQFTTYATQRIRGAMLDELRTLDWAPRGVRERAKRIEDTIQILEQRLGRPPAEGEIAAELGLSLAQYQTMLQEAHGAQLLYLEDLETMQESAANADDASALPFDLEAQHQDAPYSALATKAFQQALADAIDKLPEREKLVLSLSYEQGLNLKEIGLVLDVGEARVCQLRSQAIARLRARLKELFG